MKDFTILHTSDWHLGHQLYRFRRDEEFEAFLQWLIQVIAERQVDALLVAGDVFDTSAPPASAQKLYYDFLGQAVRSGCRHIVITAGNHDSPNFLTAPHDLLRSFDIHVVGHAEECGPVVLCDAAGNPACLVSPMPYLRERDLRCVDSVDGDLLTGLRYRYQDAAAAVERKRQELGDLPAVAMGHLFVAGASLAGEGERIAQVGNLDRVPRDIFPAAFDYVALGHIHSPQKVANDEFCRYSGSPLPMSFAESVQHKSVALITFAGRKPQVELVGAPCFRRLIRIAGSRADMLTRLQKLVEAGEPAWVEMQHDGSDLAGTLNADARSLAEESPVNILCIRVPAPQGDAAQEQPRELNDYSPEDIFNLLLEGQNFSEETSAQLRTTFRELCRDYEESLRETE